MTETFNIFDIPAVAGITDASQTRFVLLQSGRLIHAPFSLGGALDATLQSIANLGTAADKMIYTTGVDTWAETPITAFARSILDDADEATFKATVNLETGVDVQAWDADLDTLSTNGLGATGLALLDDATAADGRTTLGLGTAAVANTGTSGTTLGFLDGTNTWSGANKITGVEDATGQPPFQVIKDSSPLNYDSVTYNSPDAVLQWRDTTSLTSNSTRDARVLRSNVTGDGSVSTDASKSGGSSTSIWRGTYSAMTKSGDGSGHSYTAGGELRAIGATGYNELGLFVGTGTNTGSTRGTIHGSEVLVKDGTGNVQNSGTAQAGGASTITLAVGASGTDDTYNDFAIHITGGTGAGQYRTISDYVGSTKVATVYTAWGTTPDATSTYEVIRANDTYLLGHIARVARYYGGARESVAFFASSEGDVNSTAILTTNHDGLDTWTYGIDFKDTIFNSYAMQLNENDKINWTDGTNNSQIWFNASGNLTAAIAGTAFTPSTNNNKALGAASLRWSNGYITQLRPGDGTPIWTSGSGTPEGAVTAAIGSLFTRTDGGASTTLYVKESGTGNTGWVAK